MPAERTRRAQKLIESTSRASIDDMQQEELVLQADGLKHAVDHLRPALDSNGA